MKSPTGESLPDLLDALVNDRGKVAAAEALGVNYRTMVTCHESRHVSRRMRRAEVGIGRGLWMSAALSSTVTPVTLPVTWRRR